MNKPTWKGLPPNRTRLPECRVCGTPLYYGTDGTMYDALTGEFEPHECPSVLCPCNAKHTQPSCPNCGRDRSEGEPIEQGADDG